MNPRTIDWPRLQRWLAWATAATGLAVARTLTISIFAGPLFDLSVDAAEDLRNREIYRTAVMR